MTSWWNFGARPTPLEPAYDRSYSGVMPTGNVLTVLRDYACGCLEQRLVPASGTAKMFVSVFPINRQTWVTNIPVHGGDRVRRPALVPVHASPRPRAGRR